MSGRRMPVDTVLMASHTPLPGEAIRLNYDCKGGRMVRDRTPITSTKMMGDR